MANQIIGEDAAKIAAMLQELDIARLEEKAAKAKREALELQVATAIGVPDTWEGSKTIEVGEWKMTAKRVMNIRIDGKAFDAIRAQNMELADKLFRLKPELNKAAWKDAADEEKKVFVPALTSTPGKVSISADKNSK